MKRNSVIVYAASILLAVPLPALARARFTAPVPVKLSQDGCWKYSGRGDGFVVHAQAGERLVITAAGEAAFVDGATPWAEVNKRDIMVTARGKDTPVEPAAGNVYRFDRGGDYNLSLWPHAIQGLPSMVIVCRAATAKGA
jgi:hypothetical protein